MRRLHPKTHVHYESGENVWRNRDDEADDARTFSGAYGIRWHSRDWCDAERNGVARQITRHACTDSITTQCRHSDLVDVHHHYATTEYIAEVHPKSPLSTAIRTWNLEKMLAEMEETGTARRSYRFRVQACGLVIQR